MLVLDSQIHIGDEALAGSSLQAAAGSLPHRVYTGEMVIVAMDKAGVDGAILVPRSSETDGNSVALRAAREYPDRFGVMGRFDVLLPPDRQIVLGWRNQAGMLGMRLTFNKDPQRGLLVSQNLDWLWASAQTAALPLMVHAPQALPALHRIAERHPELLLIIDHLGLDSGVRDDEITTALEPLLDLARFPNVGVKASGLPCYTTEGYPFRDLHRPLLQVIDAFGPQRVFWGSDLSRLRCSYQEVVSLFTEELSLSQAETAAVMGSSLSAWLGWRPKVGSDRSA